MEGLSISREKFGPEQVERLLHLTLAQNSSSGMWSWLTSPELSWMGKAPNEITVAYIDNKIVGWCGIGDYCINDEQMAATFVDPEYRSRGIGKFLFTETLRYADSTRVLIVAKDWKIKCAEAYGFKTRRWW